MIVQSLRSLPNSNSCKRVGESESLVSWVSEPSDNDLDPHGNLAKVDREDVATYYLATKKEEWGSVRRFKLFGEWESLELLQWNIYASM